MKDIRTALVIGGGIAGPVAAMALQKAGIEGSVYEAYQSTADGVGGGMGIAPNGLNALAVLGADEAVRRIGIPMSGIVMESWSGRRLAEFGTPPGLPTSRRSPPTSGCVAPASRRSSRRPRAPTATRPPARSPACCATC
jgi:FAD-dependent urate hydroxylase